MLINALAFARDLSASWAEVMPARSARTWWLGLVALVSFLFSGAAGFAGTASTTANAEVFLAFSPGPLGGQSYDSRTYRFSIESGLTTGSEMYSYYGSPAQKLSYTAGGIYGYSVGTNAGIYFKATTAGTYSISLVYYDDSDMEIGRAFVTITVGPGRVPTVTTAFQTNATSSSATLGGNVTDDGGLPVTERGIEVLLGNGPFWGKVTMGSGTGVFSGTVVGSAGITQPYRAYAINANGTGYGSTLDLALPLPIVKPTVLSVVRGSPTTQTLSGLTTVTFRVTYSKAVQGVIPANFQIENVNNGTVIGTIGTITSVSSSVYDVPVTLTGGSGEFRLKVVN